MIEKTQPTDAEIEALGHRMCWRYKHDTGVNHISTFTFNAQTLLDFARAVLARWGQPARSMEPVAYCQPDDGNAGEAFSWPGIDRRDWHTTPLYTAPQPVERGPLTHAQAKALVSKYGNDPLHLVYQVEVAHGIGEGGQHGAE